MNKTYSLFLIPESKINRKYQEIISNIASSFHTQKFQSHVTLIKNLELEEQDIIRFTKQLIKNIKPIKTKNTKIEYSDRKYRSLYAKIFKTQKLLKAHNLANEIFGHHEEPFMPHLSLAYGQISMEDKLNIIKNTKPLLNKKSFLLDKLVIYDVTDENADLWKEIKTFNLN